MLVSRWLVIHAVAVCLVVLFVALGWWQLHRAEGGNMPSYGYALEWPSFALLVIGFWVKLVRDEARGTSDPAPGAHSFGTSAPAERRGARAGMPDADAEELDAYNRYLAARAGQRNRGSDGHGSS
ncbi:MAG: hypothetical protein ABJB98_09420 [Actinomycetota bacterium]